MNQTRILRPTRKARAPWQQTNDVILYGSRVITHYFCAIKLMMQRNYSGKSVAPTSQLNAYRRRKTLLFKRMKYGTISLCIIIIFLSWLQEWLPMKNRRFWNRGMRTLRLLDSIRLLVKILFRICKWKAYHNLLDLFEKNVVAKRVLLTSTKNASTLMSAMYFKDSVRGGFTAQIRWVAIFVVAGTDMKQ